MDEIYFLVRYTPFWAVPLVIIGLEFSYLFWLRKKKKLIGFCLLAVAIGMGSIIYYYWAGGPEKSVRHLMQLVRFYTT